MNSNIKEVIELVQNDLKNNPRNFDSSFDFSLRMSVDVTRGTVHLPNGCGKVVKVAVITKHLPENVKVDRFGYDDLIEEIKDGKLLYDKYFIEASNIKYISGLARILGPKGLMPNIKNGSLINSPDDWKKINDFRLSKVIEIRADKNRIINVSVGRVSYTSNDLEENINAVLDYINKSIANTNKKIFLSAFFTSTMGRSRKVYLQ